MFGNGNVFGKRVGEKRNNSAAHIPAARLMDDNHERSAQI